MRRLIPLFGLLLASEAGAQIQEKKPSIIDVEGVRVGHSEHPDARTGCTVVLAPPGSVGGVDVRGGAPGTVETDLLDPVNMVNRIDAVLIAGGSAFGLGARSGVVSFLKERGIGFPAGRGVVVPIVPGAIIFDLRSSQGVFPGPACGRRAAESAWSATEVAEGSVGAGSGATVGKMFGSRPMKGGAGSASIQVPDGLVVGALAVVNAVGDIVDPSSGAIVAGALDAQGEFIDARLALRRGISGEGPRAREGLGQNTTIVVVATNAALSKAEITKVAQMAHAGLARAVAPSHTPWDGDAIFGIATGSWTGPDATPPNVGRIGALAADATQEAILRAVREAVGIPGAPSIRDLAREGARGSSEAPGSPAARPG